MHKKLILSLLIACFGFSPLSSSAKTEFEKFCSPPADLTSQLTCSLAVNQSVTPMKAGIAMVFASIEMSGTYCNFNFSRKFLEQRIKIESDPEVARVVRYLIGQYKGRPPPGFNGDRKVFCKMQYETFGPRSKEYFFD